eukprot:353242-Chlamydomonas_euryale.AAC.2
MAGVEVGAVPVSLACNTSAPRCDSCCGWPVGFAAARPPAARSDSVALPLSATRRGTPPPQAPPSRHRRNFTLRAPRRRSRRRLWTECAAAAADAVDDVRAVMAVRC